MGYNSGISQTGVNYTTTIGANSKVSNAALFSSSIGSYAIVEDSFSLVLGAINGKNGYSFRNTKIGIGTTTPKQALHVNGQIRVDTALVGSIYDKKLVLGYADNTIRAVDAAAGSITVLHSNIILDTRFNVYHYTGGDSITLPDASSMLGVRFTIANSSNADMVISDIRTPAGNIFSLLNRFVVIDIVSDGTNWLMLARNDF